MVGSHSSYQLLMFSSRPYQDLRFDTKHDYDYRFNLRFRSKEDFLLHLVTVDETWVHYYEPENKAQE